MDHSGSRDAKTVFLDKVRHTKISISLAYLFVILSTAGWGGMEAHAWYKRWHETFGDERWALKSEVLSASEADKIKDQLSKSQETYTAIERKVDVLSEQVTGLEISAAITTVVALHQALDAHNREPEQSASWLRERDNLQRRLEQAEDYLACLQNEQKNCSLLRGY